LLLANHIEALMKGFESEADIESSKEK